MEKLKQQKNKIFAISLVVSVLFVAGIPGIILSAGKNVFLLILSIACVAFGFYGAPMFWIHYAELVGLERTLMAIEMENLYTVAELAQHRGVSQKAMAGQIKKLMDKMYLRGYIFDGSELKLNQNQKLSEIKNTTKCPTCGANVVFSGKQGSCPYCGSLVDKK